MLIQNQIDGKQLLLMTNVTKESILTGRFITWMQWVTTSHTFEEQNDS